MSKETSLSDDDQGGKLTDPYIKIYETDLNFSLAFSLLLL
jgi:hypothetical protein